MSYFSVTEDLTTILNSHLVDDKGIIYTHWLNNEEIEALKKEIGE